jgi:hypothetical protein
VAFTAGMSRETVLPRALFPDCLGRRRGSAATLLLLSTTVLHVIMLVLC